MKSFSKIFFFITAWLPLTGVCHAAISFTVENVPYLAYSENDRIVVRQKDTKVERVFPASFLPGAIDVSRYYVTPEIFKKESQSLPLLLQGPAVIEYAPDNSFRGKVHEVLAWQWSNCNSTPENLVPIGREGDQFYYFDVTVRPPVPENILDYDHEYDDDGVFDRCWSELTRRADESAFDFGLRKLWKSDRDKDAHTLTSLKFYLRVHGGRVAGAAYQGLDVHDFYQIGMSEWHTVLGAPIEMSGGLVRRVYNENIPRGDGVVEFRGPQALEFLKFPASHYVRSLRLLAPLPKAPSARKYGIWIDYNGCGRKVSGSLTSIVTSSRNEDFCRMVK
jgi:hypothetical protein